MAFQFSTIGYQASNQVKYKAVHTAVSGVFNLRDIFDLVVDSFNNKAPGKQSFIEC